jgi:hypothetical protein
MAPFHLCQPGEGASCGACCGLYNFRDHSRSAISGALARQTDAVAQVPRTREAFGEVARSLRADRPAPAFPEVRVCPLLGFLDAPRTRVGCLAHPLQNDGIDLRDCGVYTAEVCQTFECPSFLWLTDAQARLVRAACPDWYLYGLVVTDVELVRGTLKWLEEVLARPLDPDTVVASAKALTAVRRLFSLKEEASRRGGDSFGRFTPGEDGEPRLRTIDYAGLSAKVAPEDELVLCFGLPVASAEALATSRTEVRTRLEAVAGALVASAPRP